MCGLQVAWKPSTNSFPGRQFKYKALCKRRQHCWMLHVASVCTPCCILLRVGGSCRIRFNTTTKTGKRTQQRQFKDRQLNSMTFQALKMKFLNSMTFQVFHELYEPCYYGPNIAASSLRSTHGERSRRLYLPPPPYHSRVFTLQLCSRNGYSVVWNFCGIKFAPSTWVLNTKTHPICFSLIDVRKSFVIHLPRTVQDIFNSIKGLFTLRWGTLGCEVV